MKKALIVLLILAVAGGLFAQITVPIPATNPEVADFLVVPSEDTSGARFTGWWTDIFSPSAYGGMPFEKWGSYISFTNSLLGLAPNYGAQVQNNETAGAVAYGRKLDNGLYIAGYWGGNAFGGFFRPTLTDRGFSFSDIYGPAVPYGNFLYASYKYFDTTAATSVYQNSDNRVALLVGLANMGFRLAYATSHHSFDENDVAVSDTVNTDFYKYLTISHGWRSPQVMWAMSKFLLGPNRIRPEVTFTMNFVDSFVKGEGASFASFGPRVQTAVEYIRPDLILYSGIYDIVTFDSGWVLGADFQYRLTFNKYDSEYEYLSFVTTGGGTQYNFYNKKTYSGGYFDGTNGYEESLMRNRIRPRLYINYQEGSLGLRLRVIPQLDLISNEHNQRSPLILQNTAGTIQYADGSMIKAAGDFDESYFEYAFSPQIALGLRWNALPDRLTINMGGMYTFGVITRRTTDRTNYFGTSYIGFAADERTTTSVTFEAYSAALQFGLTFWFSPKFGIDMVSEVRNGAEVNLFGWTGAPGTANLSNSITSFGRIMAVLNF